MRYETLKDEFSQCNAEVLLISADPPEASRKFRKDFNLSLPLIADEEHVTAAHYEVPICYQNPRAWAYANGYTQPAVMAYQGDREVFRWVQHPSFLNLGGAAGRPRPEKLLKALRRATKG